MSKFVIITTINEPSEAISRFCEWLGWQVVVVGDRKTPVNWSLRGITYLGLEQQYDEFGEFARLLPENTYLRKMIGYLYAIKNGASAIFETDDDNLPYNDACKVVDTILESADRLSGDRVRSENGWLNIYKNFGAPNCWPRGFPLQFVKDESSNSRLGIDNKQWAIMQFLADVDPDVDAVYRMLDGKLIYFARDRRFILDEGTYCPFNSQATLWLPEAFPLLFLPVGVSDRVADILRGYIAISSLWENNYSLAYSSPVVFQNRNEHDLFVDFQQEIMLYQRATAWSRLLGDIKGRGMAECYREAIRKLSKEGAVPLECLDTYDLFLRLIQPT